MANPPNLRFVTENGRTSRYNERITEEQINVILPLLRELHNRGASRADTVAEVLRHHNVVLTKAQLDGIKKRPDTGFRTTASQEEHIITIEVHESPHSQTSPAKVLELTVSPFGPWPSPQDGGETRSKVRIPPPRMGPECLANRIIHTAVSPSIDFRKRLPAGYLHSLSASPVSHLCQMQQGRDQVISRLFRAALTLHALRAFDQAFDMFFHIYDDLFARQYDEPGPDPRLALCVICCARSSRGRMRARVAKVLVKEYHDGHWILFVTPRLRRYLKRLLEDLSSSTIAQSSGIRESKELTIRLLAMSCRSSQQEAVTLSGDLHALDTVSMDSARQHIYRCPILRTTILATLAEFVDCIDRYCSTIDEWIELHCPAALLHLSGYSSTAQIIACIFLSHKMQAADFSKTELLPPERCVGNIDTGIIPCDLGGLIAVALPHVLVQAMHKFNLTVQNAESGVGMWPEISPSLRVRRAAEIVHSSIGLNSPGDFYFSVVDLFVDQTGPFRVFDSDSVARNVNETNLAHVISLAAGAWSGILPPSAVIDEWPEIEWRNTKLEESHSRDASHADEHTHSTGLPTLASSSSLSSVSSGWRAFRATSASARKAMRNVAFSQDAFPEASSEAGASNNDYRFSVVTGLSSGPSDRQTSLSDLSELWFEREGNAGTLSDVQMSG